MNKYSLFLLSFLLLPVTAFTADMDAIQQAVQAEHRSADNVKRDIYRHPAETLAFFGLKQDMHVLEILPGRGWYTEILAPLMRDKGLLTVASFGADHQNEYLRNIHNGFVDTLNASPALFDRVNVVKMEGNGYLAGVADESQDMVVTFRNSHNWIRYGGIEEIYQAIYRVLKKGGVLGLVQHRAKDGSDSTETAHKGYVTESYLIELLENIGFELVAKSEANANPKDTKDYADGVWSLPPSLRAKDGQKEKYLEIGESDRMTLRFIKL